MQIVQMILLVPIGFYSVNYIFSILTFTRGSILLAELRLYKSVTLRLLYPRHAKIS